MILHITLLVLFKTKFFTLNIDYFVLICSDLKVIFTLELYFNVPRVCLSLILYILISLFFYFFLRIVSVAK